MPPKKPAKSSANEGTSTQRLPRTCGARVRSGRYCKLGAGHNTDHPGVGLCYRHGGNREQSLKTAGLALAHEGIMDPDIHPGDIVELEPHNALLWAVMIAGGDVSYWNQQLRVLGLELEQAHESGDEDLVAKAEARLKAVFKETRTAAREMRSAGKMAIDAGLAERQVILAERMSEILTTFARNMFARMDLTMKQENSLPDIVREEILALEAPGLEHREKPKMALLNHKKSDLFNDD